ncbi:MAG: hypothetical protein AAGA85_21190 [Bacteroidota bacterium]
MNWREIITNRLVGTKVAVLSCRQQQSTGWYWVAGLVVQDAEGNLQWTQERSTYDAQALADWLAEIGLLPLILVIDSEEIISRKVEGDASDRENLLKAVVPQAQASDFYVQHRVESQAVFVSIMRQTALQEILQLLPKDLLITEIYLAPLPLLILSKGLPEDRVHLDHYRITKTGSDVVAVERTAAAERLPEALTRANVDQTDLWGYAAGVSYLSRLAIPGDQDRAFQEDELLHKVFFLRFAKYVIAAVFLLFFVNIVFFFQLSDENEELQDRSASLQSVERRLSDYEAYVGQYSDLITQPRSAYVTRITDEIGASLPNSVRLLSLEVRPLYLNVTGEQDGELKLLLTGNTQNAIAYTAWIELLRQKSWVDDVGENRYRIDPVTQNGVFTLEIKLKQYV